MVAAGRIACLQHLAQCVALALAAGVPPLLPFTHPPTSSSTAITPLQAFQQLVELRESARVLMDLQNTNNTAAPEQGYADLKDILETWRWGGWGCWGTAGRTALGLSLMLGLLRLS